MSFTKLEYQKKEIILGKKYELNDINYAIINNKYYLIIGYNNNCIDIIHDNISIFGLDIIVNLNEDNFKIRNIVSFSVNSKIIIIVKIRNDEQSLLTCHILEINENNEIFINYEKIIEYESNNNDIITLYYKNKNFEFVNRLRNFKVNNDNIIIREYENTLILYNTLTSIITYYYSKLL